MYLSQNKTTKKSQNPQTTTKKPKQKDYQIKQTKKQTQN